MAAKKATIKKTTRATKKKTTQVVQKSEKQPKEGSFLKDVFRFGESYTSLVLGIIVFIAVATLLLTFNRSQNQVSKTDKDISATKTENQNDVAAPGSTYVVREGDDLWQIAETAYGDGYRWIDIVKANNIQDPNNLAAGTTLRLPGDTIAVVTTKEQRQEATGSTLPNVTKAITPTGSMITATPIPATPTSAIVQAPTPTSGGSLSGKNYVVKAGDTLWDISVRAYGNGYRWSEIAKINNLQNPNIIHNGNNLVLPQ